MAAKKNALGRGLGALIDDSDTPQARTRNVNDIRIDEI